MKVVPTKKAVKPHTEMPLAALEALRGAPASVGLEFTCAVWLYNFARLGGGVGRPSGLDRKDWERGRPGALAFLNSHLDNSITMVRTSRGYDTRCTGELRRSKGALRPYASLPCTADEALAAVKATKGVTVGSGLMVAFAVAAYRQKFHRDSKPHDVVWWLDGTAEGKRLPERSRWERRVLALVRAGLVRCTSGRLTLVPTVWEAPVRGTFRLIRGGVV